MKWIKYKILCNENANILIDKKIGYSEANIAIAEAEAYNGEYIIEEDDKALKEEPLAIEFGGTSASNKDDALKNLGLTDAATEATTFNAGLMSISDKAMLDKLYYASSFYKPTEGLTYSLKTNGTYECTGIGTSTETDISIAGVYEGIEVTSIKAEAFKAGSIKSVRVPGTIKEIGSYAFADSTIESIILDKGIANIGNYAFSNCVSFKSIVIPFGITSINEGTFFGCSGLTSVIISEGVTSVGASAFKNCTSLTSIVIPNGVTSIGESAFYGCSNLVSITIPHSVISIGVSAFRSCFDLKDITIPEGIKYINQQAFYDCRSLKSINIPNSVISIGSQAFYWCGLTSIIIPDGVTKIGTWAFYNNDFTSVIIPHGVARIEIGTFRGCSNLTSIVIPDSVTNIDMFAFGNCFNLADVYYTGTEEQWNEVVIDTTSNNSYGNNNDFINATKHYNYVPEN